MSHLRRLALAAATAIAVAANVDSATAAEPVATAPTAADSPAQRAQTAARVSAQNRTLLPMLYARGGVLTADGRFVRTPDGSEVSVVPAAFGDCPSGWVCLWADASYSGRLVRWSDPGTRVNLADIGFNHQMTSWANRGPYDARWFYNANFSGTTRCMNAGTSTANVGSTDNDKASSLAIYTDSAACS